MAEERPIVVPIENRGALNILIPSNYEKRVVREEENPFPTVEIYGEEGFRVMITPMWDKKSMEVKTESEIRSFVERDGERLLPNAVEKRVEIKTINGKEAKGYYFVLTDKAPKKGEYKYCLRSYITVGNLLISGSMFSNENINSTEKAVAIFSKMSQHNIDMSAEELFEKTGITIVEQEDKKITAVSNPLYHYFLVIPYKTGWKFEMGDDYSLYGINGKMQLSVQIVKDRGMDDKKYLEAIKNQYLKNKEYYGTEAAEINNRLKYNVLEITADGSNEKNKNRKQYNYIFTKVEKDERYLIHFSTLAYAEDKESLKSAEDTVKMLTDSFRGDFERN